MCVFDSVNVTSSRTVFIDASAVYICVCACTFCACVCVCLTGDPGEIV